MISNEEFLRLAADGHNRIPVSRELLADLETPLSLYLKLCQGRPMSFLLESVIGGERFGRYSFIGLPARTLLRATGRTCELVTNGMEKNMLPAERMKSINGIFKFGEIFNERKKLAAGDRVGVDWVPGVGAQVSVNGKPAGEIIKEVEFYNSVLRIWLGADPADATLKKELLGEVKTTRR